MTYHIPLIKTPDILKYQQSYLQDFDYLGNLQQKLEQFYDVKHAVLLNSATSAIHLALKSLGVKKGDKVICPSFTFVATVNPILYEGADPVFVDIDPINWNLSPILLENALTDLKSKGELPKAIILVHAYGNPADTYLIKAIANQHNIPIIEDAAGAMGSTYEGRQVGSLCDIGVVSFNNNKIVSGLGGGVLLTNNEKIAYEARLLSGHAKIQDKNDSTYVFKKNAYNYRMSLLSAARIYHEMDNLDKHLQNKKSVFKTYKGKLNKKSFSFQETYINNEANYWMTNIVVENTNLSEVNSLINKFKNDGVEVRNLWKPLHMHPFLKEYTIYTNDESEKLFQKGLSLPSSSDLSIDQIENIASSINTHFDS